MITWIVDELLGESAEGTGFPSIADAAQERGHEVIRTKYIPFSDIPELLLPGHMYYRPTVVYGTVQFCKQMERHYGRQMRPGLYFNENVKHFAKYATRYHGIGGLLNHDYYILPYNEVIWRWDHTINDPIFIKPESGLKEFTGQVVHNLGELTRMSPHHTIDEETLCVLASPKKIKAEFRYVIADRRVVTGSEYRWDNVLDVRRDTDPQCDLLAKKVAEHDWQPDTVYVVDIAIYDDGSEPYSAIVELNAFSSSGLYACDTYAIVDAVSKAAQREYDGDVE